MSSFLFRLRVLRRLHPLVKYRTVTYLKILKLPPFIMNKRMKINSTQWSVMLDFFEEQPSLITQKFEGLNGRQEYNRLWVELANKLNSMGLGCKVVEKWQKSLTDWKQKVKSKAQALKQESQRTGGGEAQVPPLNENELRLINLMGWTAIKGNDNIELGVGAGTSGGTVVSTNPPKLVKLPKNLVLTPISPSTLNAHIIHPPQLPALTSIESPGPSTSAPITNTPSRNSTKRKRRADATENELQQIHSELMGVLTSINNNMNRLADSADAMVNFLTKHKSQ